MNERIIYGVEELTPEEVKKAHQNMEKHEKGIRDDVLFHQALYISLFVVLFSVSLELMSFGLESEGFTKSSVILIKFGFVLALLVIALIKYKWFSYLEGQPTIHIPQKSAKEMEEFSNKERADSKKKE